MELIEDDGKWVLHQVELHPGFRAKIIFGPAREAGLFGKKPRAADPAWPGWLEALKARWPRIQAALEPVLTELGDNAGKGPTTWANVVAPSLRPTSADAWELSCTFSWQTEADAHLHFTFPIVGEESQGVSIDS
ncbi:MAG: hypothetical protein IT380_01200 [Myxococcales bacterium]|nr:hypothetical protein [Myxococcales bacterium]